MTPAPLGTRHSKLKLDVDEELNENRVIHLIRKVGNCSAVEKWALVADTNTLRRVH